MPMFKASPKVVYKPMVTSKASTMSKGPVRISAGGRMGQLMGIAERRYFRNGNLDFGRLQRDYEIANHYFKKPGQLFAAAKDLISPLFNRKNIFAPATITPSGTITKSTFKKGRNRGLNTRFYQKYIINSYATTTVRQTNPGWQITAQTAVLDAPDLYASVFKPINTTTTPAESLGFTDKIRITEVEVQTRMTNANNIGQIVDIYEIEPRLLSVSSIETNVTDPRTAWYRGYTLTNHSATGGIVGSSADNVATRPYDSVLFNRFYRINTVMRVELMPGSTHIHTSKYNINRTFTISDLAPCYDATVGFNWINAFGAHPLFTNHLLIVVQGLPVHSAGDTINSNKLTTSPVSIDVVQSKRIVFATSYADSTVTGINANTVLNHSITDSSQYIVQNPTLTNVNPQ